MSILENDEGESYFYGVLGGTISSLFSYVMPSKVEKVTLAITTFSDFSTGVGAQGSNGEITNREWFEIGGTVAAGVAVFFVPVIGVGAVAAATGFGIGIAAGRAGEWLGGQVYDYMYDRDSQPVPSSFDGLPNRDMTGIAMYASEGYYGGNYDAPAPLPNHNRPSSRPSDANIQQSRDIVAGKHIDPTTGQKVYADAAIRAVAAAQTKREQDIAAAQAASKAAAEAAAWQQEYNRDRQGGGDSSPSPSPTPNSQRATITPTHTIVTNKDGSTTAIQNNYGSVHYNNVVNGNLRSLPIVLDLDGDGVEISPLGGSTARFDYDGDGYRELSAWVGSDDGLLVYDIGGDGAVTQAREVVLADWTADTTDTDLDALRTVFDTNNDGILNASDTGWTNFKVWNDRDQDGAVDESEMFTLEGRNIQALDLTRKEDTEIEFGDGTYVRRGKRLDPKRDRGRIALRVKSARSFGRIIGVDQGRVARQGTHATLMAAQGYIGG